MGLQVTKKIAGREQTLYLKIDALVGNKNHTEVIANYYWDRDVSAFMTNALSSERFPMHFERESEGNPFAIAYEKLKEYLTVMNIPYSDIDSPTEEPISTLSEEQPA